jgi:hypothetical protein
MAAAAGSGSRRMNERERVANERTDIPRNVGGPDVSDVSQLYCIVFAIFKPSTTERHFIPQVEAKISKQQPMVDWTPAPTGAGKFAALVYSGNSLE